MYLYVTLVFLASTNFTHRKSAGQKRHFVRLTAKRSLLLSSPSRRRTTDARRTRSSWDTCTQLSLAVLNGCSGIRPLLLGAAGLLLRCPVRLVAPQGGAPARESSPRQRVEPLVSIGARARHDELKGAQAHAIAASNGRHRTVQMDVDGRSTNNVFKMHHATFIVAL